MENRRPDHRVDVRPGSAPLSLAALGNESGFWRKVIRGERRLTTVQWVGIFLISLTLGGVFWSTLYWENYVAPFKGTPPLVWIGARLGGWIILFVVFMLLLALLFWRARCALRKSQAEKILHQSQSYPGARH